MGDNAVVADDRLTLRALPFRAFGYCALAMLGLARARPNARPIVRAPFSLLNSRFVEKCSYFKFVILDAAGDPGSRGEPYIYTNNPIKIIYSTYYH